MVEPGRRTSTTTSRRSTSSRPARASRSSCSRTCSKTADALYLATDEDREGEAISWHLLEILKPKVPVHRLVFHEITKDAIHEALAVAARRRRRPGAGAGNAADSRPAVRLRSVAAVVAEGAAEALGRPRAERRRAVDRRARAASGWRSCRPPGGTCSASSPRRTASSFEAALVSVDGRRIPAGQGFRSGDRQAQERRD